MLYKFPVYGLSLAQPGWDPAGKLFFLAYLSAGLTSSLTYHALARQQSHLNWQWKSIAFVSQLATTRQFKGPMKLYFEIRCMLQAGLLISLLSFHAVFPTFNLHLKKYNIWGGKCSQGLLHIWCRCFINEREISRSSSQGRRGGQQQRFKPKLIFKFSVGWYFQCYPNFLCWINSLGLPFSTCPHPPLVCVLQLQPVQSCFCSPTGLFRLMRYKQTCLRWLKKLTRGQQILKIKTFCTGLIRILLLLWDQLCRNTKSLPIPDTVIL